MLMQVNISSIVFTIINLLVLFLGLRIFLFKPVRKILDERQAEADRQFNEAASKQAEADGLKEKYTDSLAKIDDEKNTILTEAKKDADTEYNRIVNRAEEQAKEIKESATIEAENQKKKILKSAEKEIADMVVDAAEKVAGHASGAEFDRSLYDEFLKANADDSQ